MIVTVLLYYNKAFFEGRRDGESDNSAIRITADNDKIIVKKMMEQHLDYLPENSAIIELKGANHRGFRCTTSS